MDGGRSVGCSQNSLTTRFPALPDDFPQVKRSTFHSGARPWTYGGNGGRRVTETSALMMVSELSVRSVVVAFLAAVDSVGPASEW